MVDYPDSLTMTTTEIYAMKLHCKIVISTPIIQYMCIYMNDFYLNMGMTHSQWICINVIMIPEEFMNESNLQGKVHNSYIYSKV